MNLAEPFSAAAGSRPLTVYALVLSVFLAGILSLTGGQLAFVLDDPYIHLALAENLPGHVGINLSEATNTSSSILFPWLLVPFAHSEQGGPWAIFGLNVLAGGLAILALARLAGQAGIALGSWGRAGLLVLFAAGFNLFGVIYTGLEHPLHIACVLFILSGLLADLQSARLPHTFWLAFALAPLIRYEALALDLLILLWWLGEGRWRRVLSGALLIVPPQLGYAFWLQLHGLPVLPTSVLYKSHLLGQGLSVSGLPGDLYNNITGSAGGAFSALFAVLLALASWRHSGRTRRLALIVLGATLAHLLFGRFGWFMRYEAYLYALDLCTLIWLGQQRSGLSRPLQTALLGLVAVVALAPLHQELQITKAAQQVWLQPLQLQRFVREQWPQPVLAMDIGAISWRNDANVVDLTGLGSESERRRQQALTPDQAQDYAAGLVTRSQAGLALLYPVSDPLPQGWEPVAVLQFQSSRVILSREMLFAATSAAAVPSIRQALERWASGLPPGVHLIGLNHQRAISGP